MSQPTDFQILSAFLDAANRARHLLLSGYTPRGNGYISPHTGELVSEERAIETEKLLSTKPQ